MSDHARETALIRKDIRSVPPKPAASAHPPRRNHHVFSQPWPFSETPQVQAKPRPGWVLWAGRAGLSSAKNPHLVLGEGKRTPDLALPVSPSARALALPTGGFPLAKGSGFIPPGLTSDSSPTPFSTTTHPNGSLRGLPFCPLTPTSSLAGRGRDPGGLALQFGTHKKFGGLISSSSPSSSSLHTIDEPHRREARSTWEGAWGSRLQPRSLQRLACPPCWVPSLLPLSLPQKALRSCMLSWTVAADHTWGGLPLLCPRVVALGSAERTC